MALHGEVIETYGSPRNIFFFVDTDHDRYLKQEEYPAQTFSTCGYAVENYIYDTEVIIAGINKYFQLNPADELCEEIRRAFEEDRGVFEARARSIMSYVVALRVNDQSPSLEKVNLNSIFKLEDDGLKRRRINCTDLLGAAEVEALPAAEVFKYARLLRDTHPNIFFRGKLVAQFVLNFSRRLAKRFGDRQKINGKPLRAKIDFSKNNLVSTFVDFVSEPNRLSMFFDEMEKTLQSS